MRSPTEKEQEWMKDNCCPVCKGFQNIMIDVMRTSLNVLCAKCGFEWDEYKDGKIVVWADGENKKAKVKHDKS